MGHLHDAPLVSAIQPPAKNGAQLASGPSKTTRSAAASPLVKTLKAHKPANHDESAEIGGGAGSEAH